MRPIIEGCTAAAGLCLFALFIPTEWPSSITAILGLIVAAAAIHESLRKAVSWHQLFGFLNSSPRVVWLSVLGVLLGLLFGGLSRWASDVTLLPHKLGSFALVAPVIGAAEEVVYRGYVQGRIARLGTIPAAAGAALMHTCYKCALFLLPPQSTETDFLLLAGWTFLGGLVIGMVRALAGSVVPCIAAHAIFDVVVYGELSKAPQWVWS